MPRVSQDEAAIRQLVADSQTYQSDVERFTALLTEDVAIVNIAGIRVLGREAFRDAMTRALATSLASVLTTTEVLDLRFVRPDVALVSCLKRVIDPKAGPGGLPASGALTYVVVRRPEGWRIALAQTTPMPG
jgi:uncharacterized protein (TIGR02246 family)